MLNILRRSKKPRAADRAAALYAAAVRQARAPAFYGADRAPDSVEGRVEGILLHVFLLVRRLSGPDGEPELAQALFDAFFDDMDAALREIGVGDLVVGKKIKKMGEAFYGRAKAYGEAIESKDDAALREAVARNLLLEAAPDAACVGPAQSAARLAAYVRAADAALGAQAVAALVGDAAPAFPPPPAEA